MSTYRNRRTRDEKPTTQKCMSWLSILIPPRRGPATPPCPKVLTGTFPPPGLNLRQQEEKPGNVVADLVSPGRTRGQEPTDCGRPIPLRLLLGSELFRSGRIYAAAFLPQILIDMCSLSW